MKGFWFSVFSGLLLFGGLEFVSLLLRASLVEHVPRLVEWLPILIYSCCYSIFCYVGYRLIKKVRYWLVWSSVFFMGSFLFIGFQIANSVRMEFGATWLPLEVFWELFILKGKGGYIMIVALLVQTLVLYYRRKQFH